MSVLIVSKPLIPPWNDSSKNLARDVVLGCAGRRFVILTDGTASWLPPNARERAVYRDVGGLAPGFRQNARVSGALLRERDVLAQHFFFAPNLRSGLVVRAIRRMGGRRAAIHTICSIPRDFGRALRPALFADVNVALSDYTANRLSDLGVIAVRIDPCIPPLSPLRSGLERVAARRHFDLPEDAFVVVYPGDYEFGGAARAVAKAARLLREASVVWVFACRLKTSQSRRIEASIRKDLGGAGLKLTPRFFNQVDEIHLLLGAADLVMLPANSTYAKMDLPLVVLESMALGTPIVIGDVAPMNEIPYEGCGFAIPPADGAALAQVVSDGMSDRSALDQLGERAAKVARTRFSRRAMGGAYDELYGQVL